MLVFLFLCSLGFFSIYIGALLESMSIAVGWMLGVPAVCLLLSFIFRPGIRYSKWMPDSLRDVEILPITFADEAMLHRLFGSQITKDEIENYCIMKFQVDNEDVYVGRKQDRLYGYVPGNRKKIIFEEEVSEGRKKTKEYVMFSMRQFVETKILFSWTMILYAVIWVLTALIYKLK